MSSHHFALFRSLSRIRQALAAGRLIAGLTVWAVLVPEALASRGIHCRCSR